MHVTATQRRARVAAMVAFATNGALPATLLARYAEVKDTLELDAGLFGLVVVGYMVGSASAFHLPGSIVRRVGSRWTTSVGTAWIGAALSLAATGVVVGNPWVFFVGLVLAGCGDAVVDVAQNAQGLRVQEVYGRSILTSMHAGWSVGATLGGLVGTAAASLGVPLLVHVGVWGVVCVAAMVVASAFFLSDGRDVPDDEVATGRLRGRALWMLAPMGLVALAGVAVEDVGNNWSAVLLATERGVPLTSSGIGLSVLLGAQFVGRLVGDRFVDSVGATRALVLSLSVVAVGLMVAAWAPWVVVTLVGLAVAGLGCAVTVPLAFAQADALPGLRPHEGMTWVNWIMRVTTIGVSPAIGAGSTLTSLPVAISAIAGLALVALVVQVAAARRG